MIGFREVDGSKNGSHWRGCHFLHRMMSVARFWRTLRHNRSARIYIQIITLILKVVKPLDTDLEGCHCTKCRIVTVIVTVRIGYEKRIRKLVMPFYFAREQPHVTGCTCPCGKQGRAAFAEHTTLRCALSARAKAV